MKEIHRLVDSHDATDLAALIKAGEIQASELLEVCIERVEKVNPELNAVAEKLYDSARHTTPEEGPFSGIPTMIKDLFAPLKEARSTNGSLALGEARLGIDDSTVGRLRAAGCNFIGTTTSPEFGASYSTESQRFGATRNPWNTAHSAGGSSGGSAALVAARAIPFAHGNDGGGSIRVPASCCGIFGLKPSRGRVPSGPLAGEGWGGMGAAHALTLSVRDSAALLDAVAGEDLGAPYAAPTQAVSFVDQLKQPVRPLRIALVEQIAPYSSSPEALKAVRATAALCESLGHNVTPAQLPIDLSAFLNSAFNVIGASTRSYLDLVGQMRGTPVTDPELEVNTRIILREKGGISAVDYVRSIEMFHTLGRVMANFMLDYDVILTPTLTREPPLIGDLVMKDENASLEEFIHLSHSYSPFTALYNATGQPAMSVPLHWTPEGLPLGSHFAGRFADEATLFVLALQLEQARPWAQKIPTVNACL